MFYDGIYTNGIGNDTVGGIWCENLPAGATVLMGHIIGRVRLTDCGRAKVLCALHYYSLEVEGAKLPKSGICGFMFHNDACHNYALEVRLPETSTRTRLSGRLTRPDLGGSMPERHDRRGVPCRYSSARPAAGG